MGKLETGRLAKGKKLIVMPNGSKVKVAQIDFEDNPIKVAVAGMNLKVSHFDTNYSIDVDGSFLDPS